MGAFQIVYDDFSGGQYMGPKPANQPKNSWKGDNVIASPNGELIPTGTVLIARNNGSTGEEVIDHWIDSTSGYVFVGNPTLSLTPRMLVYNHWFARQSTIQSTTNFTLPATPSGYVAYSAASVATTGFYWTNGSSTSSFYRTTTAGTTTTMTGTVAANCRNVIAYKLRLLTFAVSRLYYTATWSGTSFGSWSSTQYYEFDSPIINVYPRTDDLLVICSGGVYSVTGVFGSSVNIQMIIPASGVSDGMKSGDVIGRTLYYLDLPNDVSNSSLDGRLYRLAGASTTPTASFELDDYYTNESGYTTNFLGNITSLTNGRMATQFKTGWTYSESTPGVFTRNKAFTKTFTQSNYGSFIAKPATSAPNDYVCTATSAETTGGRVEIFRTLVNVPRPMFVDSIYQTAATAAYAPSVLPVGTVELSEYWHQKPFTVKEMFIEYSAGTTGSLSAYVEPTGVIDVPAATLSSVVSTTTTDSSPPAGSYRMYRYWPNNASKGFGMKPVLTLTNCTVKRVIINCED